jgi:hypothetical protein
MDIFTAEKNSLLASLEATGWQREDKRIVAPYGTIWFYYQNLGSMGTGHEFQERMRGRLERILANREVACQIDAEQWQRSYDDTYGLLKCLEGVFGCPCENDEASKEEVQRRIWP